MTLPKVFEDIVAERYHQVSKGYDAEWDDKNVKGELAQAAASFALRTYSPGTGMLAPNQIIDTPIFAALGKAPMMAELNCGHVGAGHLVWPWSRTPGRGYEFPYEDGRRLRLVKAAALIVAEIERLDRLATRIIDGESNSE